MKIALALAVIATFASATAATSLALAGSTRTAPKTLRIVMHDPGCHWFQIGGKFTKTTTISGAVRLVNLDENTLRVASGNGLRRIPVGKSIVVGHGNYKITMVAQAADDNHLRLTVS